MKPSELFSQTPFSTHNSFSGLFLDGFLSDIIDYRYLSLDHSDRIEIRIFADPYIDGHRIWSLSGILFDGKPFMVIQRGGRGGKDFIRRIIVDNEVFGQFISFLLSIPQHLDVEDEQNVFKLEDEIPGLEEFYGNNLNSAIESSLRFEINQGLNFLGDEGLFQRVVEETTRVLGIEDIELAAALSVSRTIILRWKSGDSIPHELMRKPVYNVLLRMIDERFKK